MSKSWQRNRTRRFPRKLFWRTFGILGYDYARFECDFDLTWAGTYSQTPIAYDPDIDSGFDATAFAGSFDCGVFFISQHPDVVMYVEGLLCKVSKFLTNSFESVLWMAVEFWILPLEK